MIHITGDWYVDVDQYSYILEEYTGSYTDKDGIERKNYKNVTYHATLDKALIQFQKEQIKAALSEKDMELAEAIEIVQTFNYMLKHTIETVLSAEKVKNDNG